MVRDSIKTIFKYPKMLLGFILPVVAIGALYVPFVLWIANTDRDSYNVLPLVMMGVVLGVFLLALAMQFLYFPILYNYIYEVSNGTLAKGWAKRGLKRNWWKIFVTNIIAMIPYYVFYFIVMIPMFFYTLSDGTNMYNFGYMIIMMIVLAVGALFWSAFLMEALVVVVAEENYGDGLKNAFRFGFKNYMKIVLMILAVYGSWIVLSLVSAVPSAFLEGTLHWYIAADRITTIALMIVWALVYMLLYAFEASFMFVFTNKLYAKRREELIEKDEQKLQSQIERYAAG